MSIYSSEVLSRESKEQQLSVPLLPPLFLELASNSGIYFTHV